MVGEKDSSRLIVAHWSWKAYCCKMPLFGLVLQNGHDNLTATEWPWYAYCYRTAMPDLLLQWP